MSQSPQGGGHPQWGRDAIAQGPQALEAELQAGLGTMAESLSGDGGVSFHTYSATAHIPIICFCLLNSAVP